MISEQMRTPGSTADSSVSGRRIRRALPLIRGVAATIVLLFVVPGFAQAPGQCSCDPAAQTRLLRERLESMRKRNLSASLSFTRLNQSFLIDHTPMALRLGDCTYNVANGAGLIDLLLGAEIKVGTPAGIEKYTPEARFGVYFGADMADGLDLWFSNPLVLPTHEKWVMGQSYDRGEVSAYRIMAAPTLRDSLLQFARARGYPRQNVAAECQSTLKDEP